MGHIYKYKSLFDKIKGSVTFPK